jgi:hypothetical protein
MIYVERKDKRLCFPAGCTATSFFGLAAAINQKAAAHPGSKLQGITFKSKRERVITESCPCSPRPDASLWEVRTTARDRVAIMNLVAGWGLQA